jgi:hypothetical protein
LFKRSHFYHPTPNALLSVPGSGDASVPHLPLQLENAVHQCLTRWRTSGHVHIAGDHTVTTSDDSIAVMVISTTVGARSHGNNPAGLRHLIVNLSESRSHLVRKGTGNNHDIGLSRRSTENDTEAILIVSWGGKMHHFDGTAGQTKGHGPEGGLTSPVGDGIKCGKRILQSTLSRCLAGKRNLSADLS